MKKMILALLASILGCSRSPEPSNESTVDLPGITETVSGTTNNLLYKYYGNNINPSKLPEQHRTVLLVMWADGVISNGGFGYLFEGDIPGDPEYLLMRQAFKTIGATKATSAFEKAFAVFPKSTPPSNIDRRLEFWQSKYTLRDALDDPQSPDAIYLDSMKETESLLEKYITENQAAFESLK